MNYILKQVVNITFVLFLSVNSHAQVTIGSTQKPLAGSLLTLTEETTTSKGLGMPRVELSSQKIPAGETSLATTIKNATGQWDKDAHAGLCVYNTNRCISTGSGLYVWDGNLWQPLKETTELPNPGVGTVTDHEGNVYSTAVFGTQRWMTQNMRAKTRLDGTPIAFMINGSSPGTNKLIAYPHSTLADSSIPAKWEESEGILYTVYGFFNGSTSGLTKPVRGLCPVGWRVPKSADFMTLFSEIKSNYELYTYSTTGSEAEATLASTCAANGLSKPAKLGGFDDKKPGIITGDQSFAPIDARHTRPNDYTFYLLEDTQGDVNNLFCNGGTWLYGNNPICNWCGISGNRVGSVRCIEN